MNATSMSFLSHIHRVGQRQLRDSQSFLLPKPYWLGRAKKGKKHRLAIVSPKFLDQWAIPVMILVHRFHQGLFHETGSPLTKFLRQELIQRAYSLMRRKGSVSSPGGSPSQARICHAVITDVPSIQERFRSDLLILRERFSLDWGKILKGRRERCSPSPRSSNGR